MDTDYFGKGDHVVVESDINDEFGDFVGIVRGFRNGYVIVEDQDGDCWDVEPDKLKYHDHGEEI